MFMAADGASTAQVTVSGSDNTSPLFAYRSKFYKGGTLPDSLKEFLCEVPSADCFLFRFHVWLNNNTSVGVVGRAAYMWRTGGLKYWRSTHDCNLLLLLCWFIKRLCNWNNEVFWCIRVCVCAGKLNPIVSNSQYPYKETSQHSFFIM